MYPRPPRRYPPYLSDATLQNAQDNCRAIAMLLTHGHITAAAEVACATAHIIDRLEEEAKRKEEEAERRAKAEAEAEYEENMKDEEEEYEEDEEEEEEEEDEEDEEDEEEEEEDEEEEPRAGISWLLKSLCERLTPEQETAIASVIGKLPSGRALTEDTAALTYLMQKVGLFPPDARVRLRAIMSRRQWARVEALISAVQERMAVRQRDLVDRWQPPVDEQPQPPPPPPRPRAPRPVRKRLSAKERRERLAQIETSKEPKKPATKRTKKLEKKNR